MKEIYLLTTEHLESCLWFRDDSDFKVAMNYVAVQAASCPEVDVLAFILMSNHVHFLLQCSRSEADLFVNQFKLRYSHYYRTRHGIKEFLRRNNVDVRLIPYEGESLERAIAYVQMNCVAANICSHPSQYPWGTGNSFFARSSTNPRCLGDLSARARARMLHSNCNILPKSWHYTEEGYIDPRSYVNILTVESIFRNPKRMNYFFSSSSKARKRIETSENNLPAFLDQTISAALPDLCRSLFGKQSFKSLKIDEKTELARQIKFRFSADANQIARVCGITYADAAQLLDRI